MSSILNSTALIKSIKRRAFIPSSQETFQDEDFLEMATEEINLGLMESIMEARGDYLVYFEDQVMSADQVEYQIPYRAHGNKLRDVAIVDPTGKTIQELSQIELEELSDVQRIYGSTVRNRFYIKNNAVILTDFSVIEGYRIRMWFYMRPNSLVKADRAGTIVSIVDDVIGSDDVKVLSFTTVPKHFTIGLQYDVIAASSPNKITQYDLTPIAIDLTLKTITFLASDMDDVKVGDFLLQAQETNIPNMPTELHPIIAQRVAVACLEAMGDEQNKQSAERKLAQMERSALKIITNRVEGAPKKIKQRHGTLNQTVILRRRGW